MSCEHRGDHAAIVDVCLRRDLREGTNHARQPRASDGLEHGIALGTGGDREPLEEARRNGWSVSIAIVDASGGLIAFQKMDDASLPSADISQAKARTAARFRRATKGLDSALTAGRTAYLAFPGLMPVEGGVPIVVDGKVIGGIGASGVTSQQDAQIATAGLSALKP